MCKMMFAIAVVLTISTTNGALAQSSTIWTPGQPRTFVDPYPGGGGYIVTTPGQPRTFIDRNPQRRLHGLHAWPASDIIDPSPLNTRQTPYGN